jgi:hypothetical protein
LLRSCCAVGRRSAAAAAWACLAACLLGPTCLGRLPGGRPSDDDAQARLLSCAAHPAHSIAKLGWRLASSPASGPASSPLRAAWAALQHAPPHARRSPWPRTPTRKTLPPATLLQPTPLATLKQGHAVKRGMLIARGQRCLFMDADGATRFSDLQKLEAQLASSSVASGWPGAPPALPPATRRTLHAAAGEGSWALCPGVFQEGAPGRRQCGRQQRGRWQCGWRRVWI